MSLTKPPPKWWLAEKQVCPRPFLVGHSQGSSGGMEAQGGGFCLGPCGWPFCFGLGDSVNAWSQELWIPRVHAAPAVTWPERSQRGVVSGCHRSRDISSRQPLPHPGLAALTSILQAGYFPAKAGDTEMPRGQAEEETLWSQRRKEGQVRRGGQTWLLPAPHSGRQPSSVTPVVTGGQLSEARAGAEPGDEGGWGRRRVGGWGWAGSGDAGLCGEPSVVTVPLSGRGKKRGQTWGQGGGCCVMPGMPQWGGGMMRGRGSSGHWEWLREGKSQSPKASPSPGSWPLGTCTHGAGTASLYGAGTSPEKVAS